MNAVILYDEFPLAANANGMLARAANRADAAVPWSISPWRLDMLKLPPVADGALEEAATAHLMVLAVRNQAKLPPWLWDWLETWATHREIPDAALAVFDGGHGDVLAAPAVPELSRFAERHGLSFLVGDMSREKDDSASVLDDLRAREVTQTTTMAHILEQAPHNFYPHWGINE